MVAAVVAVKRGQATGMGELEELVPGVQVKSPGRAEAPPPHSNKTWRPRVESSSPSDCVLACGELPLLSV